MAKYLVTGWVEVRATVEIEAKTPLEALKIAVKNRGGSEDLNWEDDNWGEEGVQHIQVEDGHGNVLAGNSDLSDYMRKKYC